MRIFDYSQIHTARDTFLFFTKILDKLDDILISCSELFRNGRVWGESDCKLLIDDLNFEKFS